MARLITIMKVVSHRLSTSQVVSMALLWATQSCTDARDTEPHVPARPGAYQPDGGGALIAEDDACDRVTAAEDEARSNLGCDEADRAACPAYIRPPSGDACFMYDEASVDGCVEFFGKLLNCAELETRSCIVISQFDATLPGCEPAGQGGAGGEGGAVAAGGEGGESGAASAGAPGAAGAGGQGGA